MAKLDDIDVTDSCLAAIHRARTYAQQIVDSSLAPIDGARLIWSEAFHQCFDFIDEGSDLINQLRYFVAHADDWEDHQTLPDMTDELYAAHADIQSRAEVEIRSCAAEYLRLFAEARVPPAP